MAPDAQLEWESRAAKPAAAAAFGSALLTLFSTFIVRLLISERPDNAREVMGVIDQNPGAFYIAAGIQAIGTFLTVGALFYLYRVVKFRRPELPSYALPLLVAGGVLLVVSSFLSAVDQIDSAREYFASGPRNESRAEDLLRERSGVTLGLGSGASLASAIALIYLGLYAMRAGVVSRFMGILGIVIGAIYVLGSLLPIGGPGILQTFWLGALGVLFLGRWPGGRGPAWETGEADEWPSAARLREDKSPMAGALSTSDPRDPQPAAEAEAEAEAGAADEAEEDDSQPVSRKRKKRKRR